MRISKEYVRIETEEDRAFYAPPAPLTDEVSADVRRFLDRLKEQEPAFHKLTGWLVEPDELRAAAEVFAKAAHEVYGVTLSLEDEDHTHLDAFLNKHVITERLRPLFDGARVVEGLRDADYERYAAMLDENTIPKEESLYYFLGAYWGEWLVRHRGGVWMIHPPLQPLQRFADLITTNVGSAAMMPFSQAAKKLADPAGDLLAYKAETFRDEYLPPFLLVASMADREEAAQALVPEAARGAEALEQRGEDVEAFAKWLEAREVEPENLHVLMNVQRLAWKVGDLETMHGALTALLRLHPYAKGFHNLAVVYWNLGLLDEAAESFRQAILLHPGYEKAKIALAALLAEQGETGLAREILTELTQTSLDPDMQEDARRLLMELGEH